MQAAIKKKVEKQRKRTNDPAVGSGDIQMAPPQLHRHHRPGQTPQVAEDQRTLEETLEEMMQGPQRREREAEKGEPVDLLPIVDSVFGQVGVAVSTSGRVDGCHGLVCVLCVCVVMSRHHLGPKPPVQK